MSSGLWKIPAFAQECQCRATARQARLRAGMPAPRYGAARPIARARYWPPPLGTAVRAPESPPLDEPPPLEPEPDDPLE